MQLTCLKPLLFRLHFSTQAALLAQLSDSFLRWIDGHCPSWVALEFSILICQGLGPASVCLRDTYSIKTQGTSVVQFEQKRAGTSRNHALLLSMVRFDAVHTEHLVNSHTIFSHSVEGWLWVLRHSAIFLPGVFATHSTYCMHMWEVSVLVKVWCCPKEASADKSSLSHGKPYCECQKKWHDQKYEMAWHWANSRVTKTYYLSLGKTRGISRMFEDWKAFCLVKGDALSGFSYLWPWVNHWPYLL